MKDFLNQSLQLGDIVVWSENGLMQLGVIKFVDRLGFSVQKVMRNGLQSAHYTIWYEREYIRIIPEMLVGHELYSDLVKLRNYILELERI